MVLMSTNVEHNVLRVYTEPC